MLPLFPLNKARMAPPEGCSPPWRLHIVARRSASLQAPSFTTPPSLYGSSGQPNGKLANSGTKEQRHAPCAQPSTDTRPLSSRRGSMLLLVHFVPRRPSNLLRAACGVFSFDSTRSCDQTNGWTFLKLAMGDTAHCCCALMLQRWFARCS